jgi:predicted small secreted protein
MKKSLTFITLLLVIFISTGCETLHGVKKEVGNGAQWSKEKINDGAKYIEKKTD